VDVVQAVRGGREPGGILQLVRVIDEHRPAFEYDWRTRFHLPLTEVGRSMPWGEAIRLTKVLQRDPSSHVQAALNDWDGPRSFEWTLLADLYDVTANAHFKKPRPYKRPWPSPGSRRHGRTTRSRAEVVAILNAHGHSIGGGSHG
jgi:hypothetical protein